MRKNERKRDKTPKKYIMYRIAALILSTLSVSWPKGSPRERVRGARRRGRSVPSSGELFVCPCFAMFFFVCGYLCLFFSMLSIRYLFVFVVLLTLFVFIVLLTLFVFVVLLTLFVCFCYLAGPLFIFCASDSFFVFVAPSVLSSLIAITFADSFFVYYTVAVVVVGPLFLFCFCFLFYRTEFFWISFLFLMKVLMCFRSLSNRYVRDEIAVA